MGIHRKKDVIAHASSILLDQNSKWRPLIDVILLRSFAEEQTNPPIASDRIAPDLNHSDRTVRDDTKRIGDLLDFLFQNSQTLYRVSLVLAEGRPRKSDYHRLYTFEVLPNTGHKKFHIGKLWLPLIPYLLGEDSGGIRIVHPAGVAWASAVQRLTAVLAPFGAEITAGRNLDRNTRANHFIVLGDPSHDALAGMDALDLPLLSEYHESPLKRKAFLGRTIDGPRSVTAIFGAREEDVQRLVEDLTTEDFARQLVQDHDPADPLQAIFDFPGHYTRIVATQPTQKKSPAVESAGPATKRAFA
jgi:hypothetical protein